MEFYEVLQKRRSIRGYHDTPVPESAVANMMEAVRLAPSACNRQPYRFVVVTNPELRNQIADCYPQSWVREAPMLVVACANPEAAWRRLEGEPAADIDVSIAMEHLVLAAAAEGLGTCWVCAFEVARVGGALKLEAPWRAVALTPVGYAKAEPREFQRKPVNELFEVVK